MGHVECQANYFDCEFGKVRQDLAFIGLLVQPARELRRIPLPYGIELFGCPKTLPARHLQILEKSSAKQAALDCPESDVCDAALSERNPMHVLLHFLNRAR